MRRHLSGLLSGICLLTSGMALPIAATADPLTYSFSGAVDSTSGIFSTAGSTIAGTYTFDYAAADPLVSSGSLSDVASGVTLANLSLAGPLPSSVVFTTSFASGGVAYSSPLSTATGVLDLVGLVPGSFLATDSWVLADGSGVTSSIQLIGANVLTAAGLPMLGAGTSSFGLLTDSSGASLSYHLTTLAQAPEIDPAERAASFTLLLGAVVVLRGRCARKSLGIAVS